MGISQKTVKEREMEDQLLAYSKSYLSPILYGTSSNQTYFEGWEEFCLPPFWANAPNFFFANE